MFKRANTFKLNPDKTQQAQLETWANNCVSFYNEVNYKRRQSFMKGQLDYDFKDLYDKYKPLINSATAQQLERKNSEAWKSYFALKERFFKGHIEKHPSMPYYWKNRKTGIRPLLIVVRNDCYTLEDTLIRLPFRLKIAWQGQLQWQGKQGRLEIHYDRLENQWNVFMPVTVKKQLKQPKGTKTAYFDIGVIVPIMVELEGQTFGYSGKPLLSDWWYLTKKIEKLQSKTMKLNQKVSSNLFKWHFRKRKKRFRSAIRTIIHRTIKKCYNQEVAVIYIGDLTGIRENNNIAKKTNKMLHNFWSHAFIIQAIKLEAEEYGIEVIEVKEYNTSSVCPRCRSKQIITKKRLFKCKKCKLEAHRDSVGAVNMRLAQEGLQSEDVPAEVMNRAVARPQLFSLG